MIRIQDKQEKERKQGQQKKLKEEAVVVPGMMAVLQMMMAHQAQQTQCMMQGFHGFASMLAGVSGMAGSSAAAAAAAAAPGATTGPPPLPPPTSSKLGGGDIGAPPPAQASGVPLANQGLINRRYNRGFLVRNRRGEGHVIKGSGTVTGHCNASSGLTCLQFRRVSSLHIPSLVQTIVGSRPLLAEAFTKGAIARQVLAGHLPDVHLLATTHNEDTPALPLGLITPNYYRNDAFACHKDIHKEVDYVVEPIGTNLASSTAGGKGLPPLVSRGRSSNMAEQQHHMSEGALPDPTAAILAIPQTQEVANLFSLTAVVVSSDRRHAMFPSVV